LGQRKGGLIRKVTFENSFNSYEIVYDRTRKRLPFNTGDCFIKVTTWEVVTVYIFVLDHELTLTK